MTAERELIDLLASSLDQLMASDRQMCHNHLTALRRRHKQQKPIDRSLDQLAKQMAASIELREQRQRLVPANIEFPAELPVNQRRNEIAEAIRNHQVVVVAGETGSGKTTQLPKICLSLGLGVAGTIAHTQPRRIAARSVANRIAAELGLTIGHGVGCKVRFSDQSRPATLIKLMTDGILLAETEGDRQLRNYEVIIIDEAHERSLNIDFLLGYLKRLLPTRPDLKLIITSATINTTSFSEFFGGAPVIEVSGRTYPVDICYRPIGGSEDEMEAGLPGAIAAAIEEAGHYDPFGDVLVFLPGEREIRETAEELQRRALPHSEVVPLYARLSTAEQDVVFLPHTGRRIVLATNVAETSLTVPGIRFVVDSGLARVSRYSPKTKIQRLPIEQISQASARQRAGRCGRVAAGICFRLYDEASFGQRPEQSDPEIKRTNLASVILRMISLDLGTVADFPFMEPPDKRAISDGYRLLEELQAIDEQEKLTAIGQQMGKLPVDPKFARMIIEATKEGALHEVLIVVAALSVPDPRLRPLENRQQADAKQKIFTDPASDFAGFLKLWQWHHDQSRHLSRSQFRKLCQSHYLSLTRLREWHDLHGQLLGIARELGLKPNSEPANTTPIHRALLAGLLGNVAKLNEQKGNDKAQFSGARNLQLTLFPGSGLATKPPKWVVAAELVETHKLYARTAAAIDPLWLEQLGAHLIQREQFEPHWVATRGQVNAFERVTLFGLTIVAKRAIHYGPIDPVVSRELFIRHALVQGDFVSRAPFLAHNQQVRHEAEQLAARLRRSDLLADEQQIFGWFSERLPDGIYSGRLFEQWYRQAKVANPQVLFLSLDLLLPAGSQAVDTRDFPACCLMAGVEFPLKYCFDPTSQEDGVTLIAPLPALNQLDELRLEWLVPGLLVEKVTALIKTLPKMLRKNFVPANQFATAAVARLNFGHGPLLPQLALELHKLTGVTVPLELWRQAELPHHLQLNIRLLDEQGQTVAGSRSLAELRQKFAGAARQLLRQTSEVEQFERRGLTGWDFPPLPETVTVQRGKATFLLFPAIVDESESVALRLLDSAAVAKAATRNGLRRLFMLSASQQVRLLERECSEAKQMVLGFAALGTGANLRCDWLNTAFDRIFLAEPWPNSQEQFVVRATAGRSQIVPAAERLAKWALPAINEAVLLHKRLNGPLSEAGRKAAQELSGQLALLVHDQLFSLTPEVWLNHLPRFIKAMHVRLDKAQRDPARDAQLSAQIAPLWNLCASRLQANQQAGNEESAVIPAVTEFRWLIEELRVSLFAQELKTSQPVSVARLEKRWQQIAELG